MYQKLKKIFRNRTKRRQSVDKIKVSKRSGSKQATSNINISSSSSPCSPAVPVNSFSPGSTGNHLKVETASHPHLNLVDGPVDREMMESSHDPTNSEAGNTHNSFTQTSIPGHSMNNTFTNLDLSLPPNLSLSLHGLPLESDDVDTFTDLVRKFTKPETNLESTPSDTQSPLIATKQKSASTGKQKALVTKPNAPAPNGGKLAAPYFLKLSSEIHQLIFRFCKSKIDAICLGLASRKLKHVFDNLVDSRMWDLRIEDIKNLRLGSPNSNTPIPYKEPDPSCKHCLPALYYPAHCELHHHLRSANPRTSIIPPNLTFCGGPCQKFTTCDPKEYSDAHNHCGTCGILYRRRYQRGRQRLVTKRPDQTPVAVRRWYNGSIHPDASC